MLPAALVPQVEHIIAKVCTHPRWRMTSLEDRQQECWVRILTYWPSFNAKKSSLKTWVWNHCSYACLDLQRQQHRIGPGKEWNASGIHAWSHSLKDGVCDTDQENVWELALRLPDARASPLELVLAKEELTLYVQSLLDRMSAIEQRPISLRSWVRSRTIGKILGMTTYGIFYRYRYGRCPWPIRMRKLKMGPQGYWAGYCKDVVLYKFDLFTL